MGCGTDSSAAGIIGMHAYSILDVQEVKNVDYRFFAETGVAHGNVSGFTDYDGTVRLLRIRNPHGQGEWKGDFSDSSATWEKLLRHHNNNGNVPSLERTMRNDGTFWMDYDNFLMAFSNVDVVLAFRGNHGKSFASNFAAKKSNHRCVRAFEVSLVEHQPGLERKDMVELYVMGIQKTNRGAKSGRTDRKVSYKVSDFGVLVGEGYHPDDGCCSDDDKKNRHGRFERVTGQMFGFNRNGHLRLVLDRQTVSRLVVMPVSFGHPAATDKELPFVLRFVADAPLIVRELDAVPRMDAVMEQYCLTPSPAVTQYGRQGVHKILYQDMSCRVVQMDCRANQGGTVFVYLCVNQEKVHRGSPVRISLEIQANCRGMSCRTAEGLLPHETIAKGKKFEAAWRRYATEFINETQSRLLLVLYQSGQDTEFGAITCQRMETPRKLGGRTMTLDSFVGTSTAKDDYDRLGIFHPPRESQAYAYSANLVAASLVHDNGSNDDDAVLEQALAESRGDAMLQQALEQSVRQSTGVGDDDDIFLQRVLTQSRREAQEIIDLDTGIDDADLERAIARSKQSSSSSSSSSSNNNGRTSAYEDDLNLAIQLSMQSSLQARAAKKVPAVLDLTAADDTISNGGFPGG